LRKYKRAYFVEWRVFDRHKLEVLPVCDYIIDGNDDEQPKMITRGVLKEILDVFSSRPFRLVPYFDEGIWGGKWMEEVCGVKGKGHNLAWCFDGVPEENAIRAVIGETVIELPAMDLVKLRPKSLLGEKVYARFGAEFPIRFDFLDTMDGGNLSLQVHPITDYIHDHFNMSYTQDESYYILDAKDNACVYLGVQDHVTPETLIPALQEAYQTGQSFPAHDYVNIFPVKKHDHILIPAGTIHCSGKDTMVLEISATP
ncbi:MAG: class I mannose-6-phosphate isomerase, partial [bacterium]